MTACIPRPDGFDLRLLNASDAGQEASVDYWPTPAEFVRLTLDDAVGGPIIVEQGVAHFATRPWEITTIRIRR
jgi:hypothetical protein